MTRVISIVSLGEGTGKTTLALNLGLVLHDMNHRVLVFDTDFTKKNMMEHLDILGLPINIGNVLNGEAHINDSVYRHITGLKIIPSAIHGYENFSYNFPSLLGDYDYIILDTPKDQPYLDIVLKNSTEAIIIHSPKYSSKLVLDTIDLLQRHKLVNLGIVLNGVLDDSVDEIFGIPVIEKIPKHKDIEKSFSLKNPVVHTHPRSEVSKRFKRLGKKLS